MWGSQAVLLPPCQSMDESSTPVEFDPNGNQELNGGAIQSKTDSYYRLKCSEIVNARKEGSYTNFSTSQKEFERIGLNQIKNG